MVNHSSPFSQVRTGAEILCEHEADLQRSACPLKCNACRGTPVLDMSFQVSTRPHEALKLLCYLGLHAQQVPQYCIAPLSTIHLAGSLGLFGPGTFAWLQRFFKAHPSSVTAGDQPGKSFILKGGLISRKPQRDLVHSTCPEMRPAPSGAPSVLPPTRSASGQCRLEQQIVDVPPLPHANHRK